MATSSQLSQPFPSGLGSGKPTSAKALTASATSVWGILKNWFSVFRSVQLAITLLSFLAIAVLIGVLMPQDGLVETAQIKDQFGEHYRLYKAMGFFNVYTASWFITLEVLFGLSLLFGSFKWLRPAYRAATRKTFCDVEHIRVSPNHIALPLSADTTAETVLADTETLLKKKFYTVHWDKTKTKIYAVKGNFSRFGAVVTHTGILMMLVASVYGSLTGFMGQKLAVPGDSFNLMQLDFWKSNTPQPYWKGDVPPWKVVVNDFKIDYYKDQPQTAQQYYADIELQDLDGNILKDGTISVNHPLSYQDFTIYQASFNPTGNLFVEIDGEPVTLDINTEFEDKKIALYQLSKHGLRDDLSLIAFPFFVQQDPGVKQNHLVLFMKDSEGFIGQTPGQMPANLRLNVGDSGTLGGHSFRFVKPEIATGLQMKKSPEVPWMYLSYLVICVGTVMCIFSQRKLWLTIDKNTSELLLHFKTNKARMSFIKELNTLRDVLKSQLNITDTKTNPPRSNA